MAKPYALPHGVATVLAQICCHDNQLPQGAPTSPVVSNMLCARLDGRLQRLAQTLRCTYTRYADDLTFSTTRRRFPRELARIDSTTQPPTVTIGDDLTRAISENGFRINQSKVRLQHPQNRQVVTGLTVNKHPNITRKYVNQIRAMLHAWKKYGINAAESEYQLRYDHKHRSPLKSPPQFADVVRGKLNYLRMIRGSADSVFQKYASELAALDPDYEVVFKSKIKRLSLGPESALRILECNETFYQGTAFYLDSVGLVTCEHVLGPKTQAFRSDQMAQQLPVVVLKRNAQIDLAVLDCPKDSPFVKLKRGNSSLLKVGDKVTVRGFPNYSYGMTAQKLPGVVTGFKPRHFVNLIQVDAHIVQGSSGGPVFNAAEEVIGVAVTGADLHADARTVEYGVIPIEMLDTM